MWCFAPRRSQGILYYRDHCAVNTPDCHLIDQ